MTKFLAACLALLLSSLTAAADTADVFDFSFHTSASDTYITNLGTGSRSVIGQFTGSNGTLTGFSGTFTAPNAGWQLGTGDLTHFTGLYNTVTGALITLTFRFNTQVGDAGYYLYTFGAGSNEPDRDTLSFKKNGTAGLQVAEVTANWSAVSAVPEMDGAGLASALFVFLAALAWLAQRKRGGAAPTGSLA